MSTGKTSLELLQLLVLKSSLLTTLSTLQGHIAANRDTHTRNIEALTKTHENLLSQARTSKAYSGGQQLLHPTTSSSTTTSVLGSSLAEHILNGPLRKIATLIRNEAYASRRREEDTLAIVQALEWEVRALEGVGEEEGQEKEEEEYGMGFDWSSNGIGNGHGYGYEEEEGRNVHFHQDIQFSQDFTYIWDGEGYRSMYNFDTAEDEEGQEERKGK